MKDKCCLNCFYLDKMEIDYTDFKKSYYICNLHNLRNGEVSNPESQFCGDKNWISSKVKNRLKNLDKLGI
jgi:hypothetical protein